MGADTEVVLAAVQQNGLALECASEALRADKEVVLAAVQQDGGALQFASETMCADKEVVVAAVQQDWHVLQFAAKEPCTRVHTSAHEALPADTEALSRRGTSSGKALTTPSVFLPKY